MLGLDVDEAGDLCHNGLQAGRVAIWVVPGPQRPHCSPAHPKQIPYEDLQLWSLQGTSGVEIVRKTPVQTCSSFATPY